MVFDTHMLAGASLPVPDVEEHIRNADRSLRLAEQRLGQDGRVYSPAVCCQLKATLVHCAGMIAALRVERG